MHETTMRSFVDNYESIFSYTEKKKKHSGGTRPQPSDPYLSLCNTTSLAGARNVYQLVSREYIALWNTSPFWQLSSRFNGLDLQFSMLGWSIIIPLRFQLFFR